MIVVHGTWGLNDPWWKAGSALRLFLEAKGLPVVSPDYKWTGELGGTPSVTYPPDPAEPFGHRWLTPWLIAGRALLAHARAYVNPKYPRVHLITHSHGLQVGAFACAFGLGVDTFLSISGPPRRDMAAVRAAARPNIARWVQTYDDDPRRDPTIREGMLFDGGVSRSLALPEADANVPAPGHGHSGLTVTPLAWLDLRLLDYFAAPVLR